MARVSSKGQVAVPREARRKLQLKPGDSVVFVVDDGVSLQSYAGSLHQSRGLGRGICGSMAEAVDHHVHEERATWGGE
ncbi:MAG: AbrB/MazE/SpoVT family DNA-binding domain-containing protein [Thermaerobacter sp.]|nr:AbrB/MazE/SpoVT family DNA-binding domain-containing protein [Thermaerobacter sp.]